MSRSQFREPWRSHRVLTMVALIAMLPLYPLPHLWEALKEASNSWLYEWQQNWRFRGESPIFSERNTTACQGSIGIPARTRPSHVGRRAKSPVRSIDDEK